MNTLEKVQEIIMQNRDFAGCGVVYKTSLSDDLGADSLDRVNIIVQIEKEFNIEIPDEDMEKLKTVGDIVKYVDVHKKLNTIKSNTDNSVIKYIFKTSLKQKKKDLSERKKLEKQLKTAQKSLDNAHDDVFGTVVFHDVTLVPGGNRCINNVFTVYMRNDEPYVHYNGVYPCEHFKDNAVCNKTNCKCHGKNIKLFTAAQKYSELLSAYNNFWGDKFKGNNK